MTLIEKLINAWDEQNNNNFMENLFYLIASGDSNLRIYPQKPKFLNQRFLLHINTTNLNVTLIVTVSLNGTITYAVRDLFLSKKESEKLFTYLRDLIENNQEEIEKVKNEIKTLEIEVTSKDNLISKELHKEPKIASRSERTLIENVGKHYCYPVGFSVDEYTPIFSKDFFTKYGLFNVTYNKEELSVKLLSNPLYTFITLFNKTKGLPCHYEKPENYKEAYLNLIENFFSKNSEVSWAVNKITKKKILKQYFSEFEGLELTVEERPLKIEVSKEYITLYVNGIKVAQGLTGSILTYFDYGIYRSLLEESLSKEDFIKEIKEHTLLLSALSKVGQYKD